MADTDRARGRMAGIAVGNLPGIVMEGWSRRRIAREFPAGVTDIVARSGYPDGDDLARAIEIADAAEAAGGLDVDGPTPLGVGRIQWCRDGRPDRGCAGTAWWQLPTGTCLQQDGRRCACAARHADCREFPASLDGKPGRQWRADAVCTARNQVARQAGPAGAGERVLGCTDTLGPAMRLVLRACEPRCRCCAARRVPVCGGPDAIGTEGHGDIHAGAPPRWLSCRHPAIGVGIGDPEVTVLDG